jgi:ABC-2 type transport system permease protein
VTDTAIVLGKFAGALSFYLLLWLPTAAYALILHRFSASSMPVDPGPLLCGYLGALLVGAFYLSAGLLCSAITGNQIVAAMTCFALLTMLFFTGFLGDILHNETTRRVCDYLSSVKWMGDFARGVIDTRPVVFHLSGTLLLLFITVRIVESRRWK